MIRCVILDADHTLYEPDARPGYDAQHTFLGQKLGMDRDDIEAAWDASVNAARSSQVPDTRFRKAVIRDAIRRLDREPDEDLVDAAYDRFWDAVIAELRYPDGLAEMVEQLRDTGVQVVAVASDEFPEALRRKLQEAIGTDPDTVFDTIITPRDTGTMKPDKRYCTAILDEHGISPEQAVMVGDSWARDLAPAAGLGMTTVLVDGDGGDPDHRIETITDLPAVVEAMQHE